MHHLGGPIVALTTAAVGFAGSTIATVIAETSGSSVAPWAQVTGTAAAVGGLVYVAKLLADGRLVAQPVADLLRESAHREERLHQALDESQERENALRAFLISKGTMG